MVGSRLADIAGTKYVTHSCLHDISNNWLSAMLYGEIIIESNSQNGISLELVTHAVIMKQAIILKLGPLLALNQ